MGHTWTAAQATEGAGQGIVGNQCILRIQDPYIPKACKKPHISHFLSAGGLVSSSCLCQPYSPGPPTEPP